MWYNKRKGNVGDKMREILSKNIDGHDSKLVLLNDNKTVAILLDGKQIGSLAGTTYKSITSDGWLKDALIESKVNNYLYKKQLRERSEELAKI